MTAMFNSLTDCFTLADGTQIPCVGFGTYKTPDGKECVDSVLAALDAGYRHIDTAEFYFNEESVGRAIAESGIPRDEIFVTTKVWNTHQGYDSTLAAFDASMRKLGLETLDLYLVHWPITKDFKDDYPARFIATWRALERLHADGRVHSIGVCNCHKSHLNVLLGECEVKPVVNQIEYHFGFTDADQLEAVEFSKQNGLVVEAWAPLCRGKAFGNPVLKSVAEKHGRTGAQILVRFCLEHGILPLPKSATPSRIRENADVFGFTLDADDMTLLDGVSSVGRLGPHPDEARH